MIKFGCLSSGKSQLEQLQASARAFMQNLLEIFEESKEIGETLKEWEIEKCISFQKEDTAIFQKFTTVKL